MSEALSSGFYVLADHADDVHKRAISARFNPLFLLVGELFYQGHPHIMAHIYLPESAFTLSTLLRRFFPVLALLLLCSGTVRAEKVHNLYRAAVPIATQSESDRNQGFRTALEQVLIKVSGQEAKVVSERLIDKFPAPLSLLQSFSYRENEGWLNYQEKRQRLVEARGALEKKLKAKGARSQDTPAPLNAAMLELNQAEQRLGAPPERYLLDVLFASTLIEQQMARLALPLWGETRPAILVWAVIEQKGERQLVGNGDAFGFSAQLLKEGALRGLPIFFPSADLQDLMTVNIDDVFGLFADATAEGNQRYMPDAYVMLRMYQSGEGRWNANWLIQLKKDLVSGQVYEAGQGEVARVVSAQLASYFASRYAILRPLSGGAQEGDAELLFEVDNISGLHDFVALQQYLENLAPLSSVAIERVDGTRVTCRVQLRGTRQQLFEHIELSGMMIPTPGIDIPQQMPAQNSLGVSAQHVLPQIEKFDWRGGLKNR